MMSSLSVASWNKILARALHYDILEINLILSGYFVATSTFLVTGVGTESYDKVGKMYLP